MPSKACRVHQAETADATVENWRDYGYAVDVCLTEEFVTACQPGRLDIGQPEIFRSVEDVMRLLTKH